MTNADLEILSEFLNHSGSSLLIKLMDEIVDRIGKELLTVPIPPDPEKAALVLYAKRMQTEGAVALSNALRLKIKSFKVEERK